MIRQQRKVHKIAWLIAAPILLTIIVIGMQSEPEPSNTVLPFVTDEGALP